MFIHRSGLISKIDNTAAATVSAVAATTRVKIVPSESTVLSTMNGAIWESNFISIISVSHLQRSLFSTITLVFARVANKLRLLVTFQGFVHQVVIGQRYFVFFGFCWKEDDHLTVKKTEQKVKQ